MKILLRVGGLLLSFLLVPRIGVAQIGGPPGPGEWHQTICSVPIEKTCLETSPIKGPCASESSDFVCVEVPVPGVPGAFTPACKESLGIIPNPDDTDPNRKYKLKREAEPGEAGFSKWYYYRDMDLPVCALIENCECEPPLQPRSGKCRHKDWNTNSLYRPVQWMHDPLVGCVGF